MTTPDSATVASQGLTLEERRMFMKMAHRERRKRMADQATRMDELYESQAETAPTNTAGFSCPGNDGVV